MKKKIFKQWLSLLMVAVLVLLAGCTGQSGEGDVSESSGSEQTSSEQGGGTQQEEPTDITVSFMTFGETPADMQLVEDAVNEISIREINVRVKFLPIGIGSYGEQTNLMLTSGEKLDLMSTIYWNFTAQVAKNQLMPLDELLDDYGQDIQSTLGETYIKSGTMNGQIYAVTTNRDLASGVGLIMRKDLVDKYEIDVDAIKTLDDVEAVLAIIKENEPDVAPIVPPGAGQSVMEHYRFYDPLTDSIGVLDNRGQDVALSVIDLTESETYRAMINKVYDWYQKGYVLEDALTAQVVGAQLVGSGKGFSFISPTKPNSDAENTKIGGTEMVVAELLSPFASTSSMQTFQWAIPNMAEFPEAAMKFLNLTYSNAEINNLLSWGIEGSHYVVKDDGQITYPEGVDATNTGFNLHSGWQFGNEFLTYVWEGDAPDLWEQIKAQNDSAVKSKASGFTYMSDNVKNELVACINVKNQYKIALESGMLNPEEALPEYAQALKDAGIDMIIAEKQAQLDAYLVAE